VPVAVCPGQTLEGALEVRELRSRGTAEPQLLRVQIDALLGEVEALDGVGRQEQRVDLVDAMQKRFDGASRGAPRAAGVERREVATNDAGPVVGALGPRCVCAVRSLL